MPDILLEKGLKKTKEIIDGNDHKKLRACVKRFSELGFLNHPKVVELLKGIPINVAKECGLVFVIDSVKLGRKVSLGGNGPKDYSWDEIWLMVSNDMVVDEFEKIKVNLGGKLVDISKYKERK